MKKKLAYIVLIAIAAMFPALGACYERALESQAVQETSQEISPEAATTAPEALP